MTPAFVPPPYPYDRLAGLRRGGRGARRAARSTCRSARRATRRRRRWSRPWPRRAPSAATRRRSGPSPTGRRRRAGWRRRLGVDVDPCRRRRLRRHEGARRVGAAVPAAALARARHRAAPGDRLPDLRHGRDARRAAGAVAYERPRRRSTPPTPPGRCACGSTRPANPHGVLDDLGAAAAWGRAHGVPVLSDECYVEFTWAGGGRAARSSSTAATACSPSTRCRSGRTSPAPAPAVYAGDAELVRFLGEVRKHAGLHGAGPGAGGRGRRPGTTTPTSTPSASVYRRRLARLARGRSPPAGREAPMPDGGFYLWAPAPDGDAWGLAPSARRAGGRSSSRRARPSGRRCRIRPRRRRAARRPHRARGRSCERVGHAGCPIGWPDAPVLGPPTGGPSSGVGARYVGGGADVLDGRRLARFASDAAGPGAGGPAPRGDR